ncbi:MAG: 50S ribosomal protein L22 [Actinomycetia bacterium]|nr:50S ribosomal protein L22 [Actinomycetes bacterium]
MRNEENRPSARRTRLLGTRPGAFAVARYVPVSATKVRRVVDLVRGMNAQAALPVLQYAPQAAGELVRKVVESAIQNAEENEGLAAEELVITRAFVDEGVTLRRIRARAKGQASRILKRGSHITIVVEPREEAPAPKASAAKAVASKVSDTKKPTDKKPAKGKGAGKAASEQNTSEKEA